jgi:hypothetical protein
MTSYAVSLVQWVKEEQRLNSCSFSLASSGPLGKLSLCKIPEHISGGLSKQATAGFRFMVLRASSMNLKGEIEGFLGS